MIISLVLSTAIYIVLTLVLTGIVDYRKFEGIGDPLSFIFAPQNANIPWMEFVVSVNCHCCDYYGFIGFPNGTTKNLDEHE